MLKNVNLAVLVGSFIAVMMAGTFCWLAIQGTVAPGDFKEVMTPLVFAIITGKMALAVPKNGG